MPLWVITHHKGLSLPTSHEFYLRHIEQQCHCDAWLKMLNVVTSQHFLTLNPMQNMSRNILKKAQICQTSGKRYFHECYFFFHAMYSFHCEKSKMQLKWKTPIFLLFIISNALCKRKIQKLTLKPITMSFKFC